MIAIIDYGVGNLFSLAASLTHLKIENVVTADPNIIEKASHIILPGVGAFGDASQQLFSSGLGDILKEQSEKKPFMGICLGMQLLFETGHEFGTHKGLGFIPGEVVPMAEDFSEEHKSKLKVPHMGWNSLTFTQNSPLFSKIKEGDSVYFVHSFYGKTDSSFISSTAEYGIPITATVEKGHIFGCQFHPEKSGKVGLNILSAFYETTAQK